MIPQELRYLATHEWARQDEKTGTVIVGITDKAIEMLGDIVYLELPKAGAAVRQGEPFGTIESVKAASDLYAPVSGKIVAVNEELPGNLERFKADAYGQAWMVRIQAAEPGDYGRLLSAGEYEKQAGEH